MVFFFSNGVDQMIGFVTLFSIFGVDLTELVAPIDTFLIGLVSLAFSSIFILEFYEFISTKDIFKKESNYHKAVKYFKEDKARGVANLVTAFEYVFLFPLIVFFWAFVFFVILLIASEAPIVGSLPQIKHTLMLSVMIVGAVRICAYYRRKIAEDLSKLLPLVLVGNFLIREVHLSFTEVFNRFEAVWDAILNPEFQLFALHYFILLILIEMLLRGIIYLKSRHDVVKKSGKIVEGEVEEKEDSEGEKWKFLEED